MSQRYCTAVPIVYIHAGEASVSWEAKNPNAVSTITGPSRLSGRARQEVSPLPSSEAPRTTVSTASGSVGRVGVRCAARYTAATSAAAPAPATAHSLSFISSGLSR
jgi:hypothetical protein